jgi:hypothetical protein
MHDDSTTRRIPLTDGRFALVDDCDYEMLSAWTWGVYDHRRNSGYVRRSVRVRGHWVGILMHRQIMLPDPGQEVDHINHDLLDNRRANLRLCTHQWNLQNRAKSPISGSSQYKGVRWENRHMRWLASIGNNGKTIYVGEYRSERAAAHAYDAVARKLFGDFACLNFPQGG